MTQINVIDLFRLTNKVAFVTGGAKGLGIVINEGLLEAGVKKLFFCGRGRHGSIEAESSRLTELFPEAEIIGHQCDISDESQIGLMIEEIKTQTEQIDILVNNAGVTWATPSTDQTMKSWHRVIDTNLTGTFLITRDIAREFMIPKTQGSSIINISSVLAIQGNAEAPQVGYTASKSALLGLTRQLAIEWAIHKIRVNCILPSFVEGIDSMAKMFT
ncbi:MAG: SDR family NAD(P)-dependent oxidoreductase, partial [Candidatus Hodarchaeales archaeon]